MNEFDNGGVDELIDLIEDGQHKQIRVDMSSIDGQVGELIYLLEEIDSDVYQELLDTCHSLQNDVTNVQTKLKYI